MEQSNWVWETITDETNKPVKKGLYYPDGYFGMSKDSWGDKRSTSLATTPTGSLVRISGAPPMQSKDKSEIELN